MTKTEALRKGLLLDGWTPVRIARTGASAFHKRIACKDSDETLPAWAWIGGGATLRVCIGLDTITKATASPRRAARMIALGMAQSSPAAMLSELEAL